MSVEVIHCPACQHQLRVPESLFGEAVTCPQCRVTFRAPTRQADGTMGQPEMMRAVTATARDRKSALLFPALALLFVSLISALSNGVIIYRYSTDPDKFVEAVVEQANDPNNPARKMFKDVDMSPEKIREAVGVLNNASIIFGCMSVLGLLGALAMMVQRFYWLAIVGNVAAIINLGMFCCLVGAPTGIWGLVKLFDPELKALFGGTPMMTR